MASSDDAARLHEVQRLLFGQSAPISTDGHGRCYLARCPTCGMAFVRNGRAILPVPADRLMSVAAVLSANPATLPAMLCESCHRARHGGALFEVDEYRAPGPVFGFGWSWEGPDHHLLASLFPIPLLPHLAELHPDILTQPRLAQAALRWLAGQRVPQNAHALPTVLADLVAADNPPGHGAPGTEGWGWRGVLWPAQDTPMGPSLVLLLQALPPAARFDPTNTIALWRAIVAHAIP
jgi:hypothetical protein